MSRELKFRCWNNCLREYIPEEELLEAFGECINEDHLYIEQYIGLKDKNGKEIYEGDIVSVYEFDKKSMREVYKYTTDIRWNNRSAMFWTGYAESLCDEITEDHYEVIGNIHENPELLGGEE